jgi:hypothetical protein
MTAADFAEFIAHATHNGRTWTGCCPAHEDRDPSLSWADGDKGLVVHCHTGCTHAQICAALGIEVSDLFRDRATGDRQGRHSIATYDYRDLDGSLLYQVVRYEPKDFRQRRPDGRGGWIWNLEDTPRVLYRLPELQGQPDVVIVEGEKDADRLWALGIAATTCPMGAGKWQEAYTEQLLHAGMTRAAIIGDNDQPGQAHAREILASLGRARPGGEYRVVRLPGWPPVRDKHGEDVSDWIEAGQSQEVLGNVFALPAEPIGSQAEVVAPRNERPPVQSIGDGYLITLPEYAIEFNHIRDHSDGMAAEVTVTLAASGQQCWGRMSLSSFTARSGIVKDVRRHGPYKGFEDWLGYACRQVVELERFGEPTSALSFASGDDVEDDWLLKGWIPAGDTSVLYGGGGSCKSYLALLMALSGLTGCRIAGSEQWAISPLRSVLYLDWEARRQTHIKRMTYLARGMGMSVVPGMPVSGMLYRPMSRALTDSMPAIRRDVVQHHVDLVIVDSLSAACGAEPESADAAIRTMNALRSLEPATRLVIAHITKASAELERGQPTPYGSTFVQTLPRSTLLATRAEQIDNKHSYITYSHTKTNDEALQRARALHFDFSIPTEVMVSVANPDSARSGIVAQILEAISEGLDTVPAIAKHIDASEGMTRKTLNAMEEHGSVVRLRPSVGGRGQVTQWGRIDRNRTREPR